MFASARQGPRTKSDLLTGVDCARSRLVARNTVEWFSIDGIRHIRLHDTDILTFRPDGSIAIDTGDWNTHTTRDRLNGFLPSPWRVWTHRGVLNLHGKGDPVAFRRHVEIGPRGAIRSDNGRRNIHEERDRKLIDSYMRRIRKLDRLPLPSGGDPWIPVDQKTGKYPEIYMREWMREGYVFGSLIVAAGRYAGLQDVGIQFLFFSQRPDATEYRRIRRFIRACLGYCA